MTFRSHHGCARCKHRRQKCDEKRPSCTRCKEAAVNCEYVMTLKWDGRVPRKQEQVSSRRRRRSKTVSLSTTTIHKENLQQLQPETYQFVDDGERGFEIMEIDPVGNLSSCEKLLLNHYVSYVSKLNSHSSMREQACQILPVALEIPSLLYATLALSALHLSALGESNSGNGRMHVVSDLSVDDILACSITNLRQEIEAQNPMCSGKNTNMPGLLYTVKTLCLFEIYSGKYDSSWRAHLKGARALLNTTSTGLATSQSGGWLIARWYITIEALSALTNDDDPDNGQQAIQPILDSVATQGSMLDIYAGYSADLHLVFKDIGRLMQHYASAERNDYCNDDFLPDLLRHCDECIDIEQRVENMITRDKDGRLRIPAAICLSPEEYRMFSACNTAYQFSALLHIRRRLHNMAPGSEQVQQCVKGILNTVCNVRPIAVLSPWILLTTPIFTAGCEAIHQDRETVKQLLIEQYTVLRIRNILRAVEVLERHWKRPDAGFTDVADFLPF